IPSTSRYFINFSSLHDQNALRLLPPLIGPKKPILTAGRPSETRHLAESYRERAAAMNPRRAGRGGLTNVFFPRAGERTNSECRCGYKCMDSEASTGSGGRVELAKGRRFGRGARS